MFTNPQGATADLIFTRGIYCSRASFKICLVATGLLVAPIVHSDCTDDGRTCFIHKIPLFSHNPANANNPQQVPTTPQLSPQELEAQEQARLAAQRKAAYEEQQRGIPNATYDAGDQARAQMWKQQNPVKEKQIGHWVEVDYSYPMGLNNMGIDTYLVGDIERENGEPNAVGPVIRIKNISSIYPAYFYIMGVTGANYRRLEPNAEDKALDSRYRVINDARGIAGTISVKYWIPGDDGAPPKD